MLTLPLDEMRSLSAPLVSNEIVSAAGNLIFVFVSPVLTISPTIVIVPPAVPIPILVPIDGNIVLTFKLLDII